MSVTCTGIYLCLGDEDVLHVLKNRQIVGGSRAEDHMSRCAIQDVFELHQNSQEPAAHCQPLSEVRTNHKFTVSLYLRKEQTTPHCQSLSEVRTSHASLSASI